MHQIIFFISWTARSSAYRLLKIDYENVTPDQNQTKTQNPKVKNTKKQKQNNGEWI